LQIGGSGDCDIDAILPRSDSLDALNDTWTRFLQDSGTPAHGVQVYADLAELSETVAVYLTAGFAVGEPAVVIATPEHWTSFAGSLADKGWDADRLERDGLLVRVDAVATLAAVSGDDGPSWEHFEAEVGALLNGVAERFPGRPIRAFGEMVDLLCEQGDPESAATLEELWNRLALERPFSLLCGYHVDPFDREAQVSVLPAVCRAHTHVLPAHDSDRFSRAVDAALDDALGLDAGKVYALIGDKARQTQVPEAQLALMWVSAHMPASADRILAAARTRYAHEPAA
jgi:hypothetical protein